jgi:hypothetical protein
MTYTLEIEQDPEPCNPRTEFDCFGKMVCFHKRYSLGDRHDYRTEDFGNWDEMEGQLVKDGAVVVVRLFLLDHSGISISTEDFNDRWDSGVVGFYVVTRKDILDNFLAKRLTKKLRDKAREIVKGEVETYNQYLQGDVWGFVIKDEDGEIVDSCWGFYGREYAEEEGKAALASFQEGG